MNIVVANSIVSKVAIPNAVLKEATPDASFVKELTKAFSAAVRLWVATVSAVSQFWHSQASKATAAIQKAVVTTSSTLHLTVSLRPYSIQVRGMTDM